MRLPFCWHKTLTARLGLVGCIDDLTASVYLGSGWRAKLFSHGRGRDGRMHAGGECAEVSLRPSTRATRITRRHDGWPRNRPYGMVVLLLFIPGTAVVFLQDPDQLTS